MPGFYDIDRANGRLPELRETLLGLRSLREELIELRDRIVALNAPALGLEPGRGAVRAPEGIAIDEETRRLQLRMQGIVDQMQAAVAQVDAWGITLRDIPSGLVDFPALVAGRQVWLCWRIGEEQVGWWHELTAGVAGRQRLEDLH